MKKGFFYIILSAQFAFLLNGCTDNQNVYEKLERNVVWSDENKDIEFVIQGPEKGGLGFGTIRLKNNVKIEGDFGFTFPHYKSIRFTPTDDNYLSNSLLFNVKYSNRNGKEMLGITVVPLSDIEKQLSFGWNTVYVEKRKLSDSELDAKYFCKREWSNEDNNFFFSRMSIINSKTIYYPYDGVFYDANFIFNFLILKRIIFIILYSNILLERIFSNFEILFLWCL